MESRFFFFFQTEVVESQEDKNTLSLPLLQPLGKDFYFC